jgi:hypothetical protein
MIDYFAQALAVVKRRRLRLSIQVTAEILGGAVTVAATARIIELDQPWWLITLGFLAIGAWALQASRTSGRLEAASAGQAKFENIIREATNAAGLLRDIGFSADVLRAFTGPTGTDTTTAEDTDTTPAPADETPAKS